MTRLRPRKPSASMIVAITALVLALGGTSYAALSLPKNSVGTKQLKKNAVTTSKIKSHAVTAAKINPAGLTVPSATHASSADSATHAAGASTVDGSTITPVARSMTPGTTATLFHGDGLTLTAVCNGSAQVGITAQSSDPLAELNWFGNMSGAISSINDGTGTSPIAVLSPGSQEGSIDIEYGSAAGGGGTVTADLGTDYDDAFDTGSSTHCGVWGTIVAG